MELDAFSTSRVILKAIMTLSAFLAINCYRIIYIYIYIYIYMFEIEGDERLCNDVNDVGG